MVFRKLETRLRLCQIFFLPVNKTGLEEQPPQGPIHTLRLKVKRIPA